MTILEAPDTATAVDLPRPGAWSIEWRGRRFTESMMTGQHLATLALLTGTDDYETLDVDPRHGHQRLMHVLAVFLCVDNAKALGADDADEVTQVLASAISEVSSASVDEILGSIRFD